MRIDILTVLPEMIEGMVNCSIVKRAQDKGLAEIHLHNLRDYTTNKWRRVDDYPFGGEAGMVMQIEPIDRAISALKEERTYDEVIYNETLCFVEEDGVSTPDMVRQKINDWYEHCDAGVFVGFDIKKDYDIMFATGWQTVDFVRKLPAKKKAYFIQDYEPWFFPMGDQYLITENSYKYGYLPVTIGKWLAHKMDSEFNTPAEYFDFGADLNVYKPLDIEKENAICYVYQPEKPRRCDYIGLKALKLIKAMRPDVKIYLYGSELVTRPIDFECENLHIIPVEECNKLYNKCKVGICMSASNPSRIPFEMMAAGLPVVELYKENNLYDLPDGGVLLSETTPEAIASSVVYLLDNPKEAKKMSEFGVKYMKDYPLERGFGQIVNVVKDMIETEYNNMPKIEKLYKKPPFKPSEESQNVVLEQIKQEPIYSDSHGKIYRFLRRCKRMLMK